MDYKCLVLVLVAVISVVQPALSCSPSTCLPPNCRCLSQELGAGFPLENTPQLVMITFDAAVTAQIYDLVMPVFDNFVNPDGCPAAITYFASHEYTDYSKVHSMWANGHEVALNSISYAASLDYWRTISMDNLTAEFGGQRTLVSHFGKMEYDEIYGIRIPALQMLGDNPFKVISELGLVYDSTWATQAFNHGLWPYTLDYSSSQDCPSGSCPTAQIPGVWVIPIPMWEDLLGYKCAMIDACINIPSEDLDALVVWLKKNFHRVYDTTKAPFPISMNGAWLLKHVNHLKAYDIFLNYLDDLHDVYFVSQKRVIEYVQNPRPIGLDVGSTTELSTVETDEPFTPTTTTEEATDGTTETATDSSTTEEPLATSTYRTETATDSSTTEEPSATPTDSSTSHWAETTFPETETSTDSTAFDSDDELGTAHRDEIKIKPFNEANLGYQIFDSCQAIRPNTCISRLCSVVREDTGEVRWMTVCAACPAVFPWKNNPLGQQL